MQELGSSGRLNFFWEPMAAGKGGAENMAATTLMRVIHECICSGFLRKKAKIQMGFIFVEDRGICPAVPESPQAWPWPAMASGTLPTANLRPAG